MGKKLGKSKSHPQKRKGKTSSKVRGKSLPKSEKKMLKDKKRKIQQKSKINITISFQSNQKEDKYIFKKKKLKALKYFNIQPKKILKEMNISELKEFAHKFDLNAKVNYIVLSYLNKNNSGEYQKYIDKYRFTLDFQDALDLKCFDIKDIKKMMNEYNKNIKQYKLNIKNISSIKEIKYFSKMKLFNLLFFLASNEYTFESLKNIEKKILSYSISESLVFKVPTKFGNIELQYYFYLLVIINILLSEKSKADNSNEKNSISQLNEEIFFDFCSEESPTEKDINLKDFYERKTILDNYISGIEIEGDIFEKQDKLNEKDIVSFINDKRSIFQEFSNDIKEVISLKDDVEILKRVKFICYLALFFSGKDKNLKYMSGCLKVNNYSKKEIKSKSSLFIGKLKAKFEKNNYKEVVLSNIGSNFMDINNNPFDYNAFYYSFPYLLKQNIIEKDNELFESFKDLLKNIYTSDLIRDIYYLTPEFKDFLFPFYDKDILNELIESTIFLPFPNHPLMGYTQKEIPEILIPVNFNKKYDSSSLDFSDIVCQISQFLNTCIHEHIKHYIKALIFYNSFPLKLNSRKYSNCFEMNEERKIVEKILKKNNSKKYRLFPIDGGEKGEVLMHGDVLDNINFGQSLELFKKDNWYKSIPAHIQNFIASKENKNVLQFVTLKEIENSEEFCKFYKILAKKYLEHFPTNNKKGDNVIVYNYDSFATKRQGITREYKEGYIRYDYDCFATCMKGIKDSSC